MKVASLIPPRPYRCSKLFHCAVQKYRRLPLVGYLFLRWSLAYYDHRLIPRRISSLLIVISLYRYQRGTRPG